MEPFSLSYYSGRRGGGAWPMADWGFPMADWGFPMADSGCLMTGEGRPAAVSAEPITRN